MLNTEPRIWRNGIEVREIDVTSDGKPPAEEPVLPEEWTLCDGTPDCCVELRYKNGGSKGKVKWYRAIARLNDERYDGEQIKISPEFKALDAADVEPVGAYAFVDIRAEQHKREIAAAIARHDMRYNEAALSDMRKIAKELLNDLLYPYKQWTMARERRAAKLLESADLRAQVQSIAEDIASGGMRPEYELFIGQLRALLSVKESE